MFEGWRICSYTKFHLFPLQLIQRSYRRNVRLNFVWSQDFKCSVRTYTIRLSFDCCLITILLTWTFLYNKNHKSRVVRFWNVHYVFGIELDHAPLEGGLDIGTSWNIIHVMTCRIACSFFIHPNILGHVHPRALVKRDGVAISHQQEILDANGQRALKALV